MAAETSPAFVLLSFEGPDAYSRAGGLGTRVSGLATALADEGYDTHLFYIGAPDLPGYELAHNGHLHLHRWCQWISLHHGGGVYDGEEGKLCDWNVSLPGWIDEHLLPNLVQRHRPVVVIAEEWHTSFSIVRLARRARERGLSEHVRFYWNANNSFGFDRVPWRELDEAVTITTVSRFMKHEMWRCGVDPRVIPNGIASQWLEPWDRAAVQALRRFDGRAARAYESRAVGPRQALVDGSRCRRRTQDTRAAPAAHRARRHRRARARGGRARAQGGTRHEFGDMSR